MVSASEFEASSARFVLASQRRFLHIYLPSTFRGALASSSVLLRKQSSHPLLLPFALGLLAASPELCPPSLLVNSLSP